MTQNEWRVAVTCEMQADLRYAQPEHNETLMVAQPQDTGRLYASRNGNTPEVEVAAR
jgi:hypothetical protein